MTATTPESPVERDWRQASARGLRSRCPACGEGKLFQSFVKPVDHCAACGEDMTPQRADDFPPYVVITVVGHIVVGAMLIVEQLNWNWSTLTHALVWGSMVIVLSLLMMQPVKGAIIGLQWAQRMHGFGGRTLDGTTPIQSTRK